MMRVQTTTTLATVVAGAVRLLGTMLLHVGLSLAVSAMVLVGCVAADTVAGPRAYASYLSAVLLWDNLFFSVTVWFAQASVLMRQKRLAPPHQPLGFRQAMMRLTRQTTPILGVCLTVSTAIPYLLELDHRFRAFHVEFYVSSVLGNVFIVSVWIAARTILYGETVRGRELLLIRQHTPSVRALRLAKATRAGRIAHGCRFLLRNFFRGIPTTVPLICAGAYVQGISQLILTTKTSLLLFSGLNLALKLILQEVIKHLLVHHRVHDPRPIFLAIGLPTVLIDTQVRVKIQQTRGGAVGLSGTAALALVEIIQRWTKLFVLRQQLGRDGARAGHAVKPAHIHAWMEPTGDKRRQHLLQIHAAEAFADMTAEYMAIGSAAMILYRLGSHPRYAFVENSTSISGGDYVFAIAIQVVVEIVVDFVSCILELRQKVDFAGIRKFHAYIAVILVGVGIMNIHISAIMYAISD